ncbi:TPA: hypothetical protein L3261_002760 [Elizabethkingia anophelis]|nr:hypothetical protein [Elizabethkingia anophelis]HBN6707274.1 hypothetical protein [Elizabethkingia anophelis]HBN6711308.1 hypothetical protein [Elizabethkingia anophelis]HBN6714094.1 hypothetical protein [Elizabethkingia anophelis]HBN6719632.1 hypothetical protein [Elizabethkingia anophelis]
MKAVLPYRKEAGNHKFRRASLIAVLQERQHEIRTEQLKACKPENNMM